MYKNIAFSIFLILSANHVFASGIAIDPYEFAYENGFSPKEVITNEPTDYSTKEKGVLYFDRQLSAIMAIYLSIHLNAKQRVTPYIEDIRSRIDNIRR